MEPDKLVGVWTYFCGLSVLYLKRRVELKLYLLVWIKNYFEISKVILKLVLFHGYAKQDVYIS